MRITGIHKLKAKKTSAEISFTIISVVGRMTMIFFIPSMCGIIGISNRNRNCVVDIYDGLLMLQHRGQDAAGIVTYDGGRFHERKANGLVRDVFKQRHVQELTGSVGIGHVRYPTAGSLSAKEAQPFFVNAPFGIFLVHNGNLTNAEVKRKKILKQYRRHLRTSSDSEVLLNSFADKIYTELKNGEKDSTKAIFSAVSSLMGRLEGAYSVICLIDDIGLLAFRDPYGIRPLSLGKRETTKGEEWAVASEDVAFQPIGFKKIRDVAPGEAILITKDNEMISHQCVDGELNPCIFEYIYLARPDSMLDGISVYKTQLRLGQKLVEQISAENLQIDSVMPVPDSSRPVALEIANQLGIKYREGLVKNRYVGRTFIMPDQRLREQSVRRKLNTIGLEFKGRNILLVDDSIVRGTTMKQIVEMCRKAGAKNVYVASAAPPVRYANVYGVDMPTNSELIAHGLTIQEIEKVLNIDKLFYQTVEDLIDAAREGNPEIKKFDCSCFDGHYVTGSVSPEYLASLEKTPRNTEETNLPLIAI